MNDADPCDTCLRWYECNGIDKTDCPLCNDSNGEAK